MSFTLKTFLICVGLAIVAGFVGGFCLKGSKASAKVQALETQASVLQGKIEAEVSRTTALESQEVAHRQAVDDATAKVQTLQTKVDQDKKNRQALENTTPATGPEPDTTKDAVIVSLKQENADQGALIDGLKLEGASKDALIRNLSGDRDTWKQTAKDAMEQARLREIALQAQQSATKASLWKGRGEGFLAGIAVGFAGGRFMK